MLLLVGFAFISGLVTILAPCIWPLLPIVLSSSIAGGGGHKRPLGITLGIMLSFMIFTLSISFLVKIFHLDPNSLRLFAVIIIGFLGLTMVVPPLTRLFEKGVTKLSNLVSPSGTTQKSGFWGGFITGLSLGIVWSPCAGPILASIAALAATGQVSFQVVLVTFAYVLGVGIPLFAFAYGGQRFITKSKSISRYTGRIQQVFGVIMILTAVSIYTNYDKVVQIKLLETFPAFGNALNGFESNGVVTEQLSKLKGQKGMLSLGGEGLLNANVPAPEFAGITTWLNLSQGQSSLTMEDLKGKVVLIDFWTYTCINCIRTFPHVTSWYDKYKDDGFVVIGVHTPEFAFEKETDNVRKAMKQYNIQYPVAQDNDFATWNAYQNQYWPAEYLIDAKGVIRRTHFGEGEYTEMEEAIRMLLKENGKNLTGEVQAMPDDTPTIQTSPETYLGSGRMLYLMGDGKASNGQTNFTLADTISPNKFSFGGTWTISDQYATADKNAVIAYNFSAGKVFLVMRPGATPGKIKILLDGRPVDAAFAGKDVTDSMVTVDSDRLYDLIALPDVSDHLLRLEFQTPGIQAYAFTFGD